jgi:hypothetical protein
MWPFTQINRNRYERRYRSAWTLLLARYTYEKLTPEQQAAVRERDAQYLRALGSAAGYLRGRSPQKYFSDYVIAMKSLGIPPALEGERWPIPDDVEMPPVNPSPWAWTPRGHHKTMTYWRELVRSYRNFNSATEDARRDLAARGVDVQIVDPNAIDDVHHFDSHGKPVSWRQWWLGQGRGRS